MAGQNKQLDDIFHTVSRYIVILPAILIVVAIFFKLTGNNSSQLGVREYAPSITPSAMNNILGNLNNSKEASPAVKFNLTGPLTCSFATKDDKVDAYIKDKKILIKREEENIVKNYLLNGDCGYIWKQGTYSGEKICGISQQVAIVDGLLSSGFLDPNTIFENLGKMLNLPTTNNSQDTLKLALSSCKNETVPNLIKLDVPKNVLFKNSTLK